MSCIVAFGGGGGGGGGGHNFLQKNLSTLTIIIIIIYIYTKRWRKIKKIVTWSIHMWNLLRSRSLLLCDWIVFTHQQAGVSKKKCRGQLLRLGATFFSRPTIMFCRSFFFFLFRYFSFFVCPEDACKNSNNNSKEGTQNGRWRWWVNTKWQWRFELRITTRMIHFHVSTRELPYKIFRIPSIFHGFFHEGFNREKSY